MKNRWKELSSAELHYNAAILALSSFQSSTQCDPWSPNSSTSALPSPYSCGHAGSVYSDRSAASSVTSLGDEGDDCIQMAPKESRSTSQDPGKTLPSPQPNIVSSISAARPQTPQQFYFSANVVSFVGMIEGHLADVREQKHKTAVPTVRFIMPSPRTSPTKTTRHSQSISIDSGSNDEIWKNRRNIKFRPRFDPTSVQKLCNEALAELSE